MIYFMFKKTIYLIYFFISIIYTQNTVFDNSYGFVTIECDSANIPIYIDGDLIGHTPINRPIPLIVGNHYIDVKPLSISNPFSQRGQINSSKNIYIFNNDTVKFILNPYSLQMRSEKLIKERLYTSYIGLALGLLSILQLWVIS